jgi:uncharacterized tellurite resistance protein B-like protein
MCKQSRILKSALRSEGDKMGIFARFRPEVDPVMTPQLALAGLLVAVSGSSPTGDELNFISSILMGPCPDHTMVDADTMRNLQMDGKRMIERSSIDDFLMKACAVLNEKQKLAILINLMDLCLVDGSVLEGERLVFEKVREAFHVSHETLRPYVDMLTLKNDPSIRPSVMAPHMVQAAEAFRSLV